MSKTAPQHLQAALDILSQRGQERDMPNGERSMRHAVHIFNAITGRDLSECDGWTFMMCVKLARARGGAFKLDDYQDLIGYAGLLAECAEAHHEASRQLDLEEYIKRLNVVWKYKAPTAIVSKADEEMLRDCAETPGSVVELPHEGGGHQHE